MTIGSRIKIRREELGISQTELAQRLGYKSRSSINKIELGERSITQQKIKAIADALNTTPSYIMGWKDISSDAVKDSSEHTLRKEWIDCYERLTERERIAWLTRIEDSLAGK